MKCPHCGNEHRAGDFDLVEGFYLDRTMFAEAHCPDCGKSFVAVNTWVEIDPSQRADFLALLKAYERREKRAKNQ